MTILKLIRCLQYSLAMTSIATLGVTQLAAEVGNPRVNQVGYLPNGPKIATLNASTNTANHWELRQNNTVITSGTTTPRGFDVASGNTVHQINFSQITQEGNNFTLHVGADQSYPFSINKNILTGALYDSLRYFYHNRSGIAIETPYTGGGRSSYGPNARWSRPAGHLNTSPNTGDSNVACWPGTCNYSLNVTKGWYDAGDHGKYVVNGGISVWKLLNMYERALHLSDNAKDFADNTLNIPESGNGVADILDEARWEIEFLLSMQVPANQPLAGMAHHKMHDQGWTGLPLAPHEDPNPRYLVPPSTAATLNLAAVAAQCARLWKNIDTTFANTCLTAAKNAWNAAIENSDVLYSGGYDNGGGAYGDNKVSDEFYWAAAELFISTGESQYANRLIPTEVNYYYWGETELLGVISLATVPTAYSASQQTNAQQRLITIANETVTVIDNEGYHTALTSEEYTWGSNNNMANKLSMVALAYDFSADEKYAKAVIQAVDYLFGRNVLSLSYVSGHGENAIAQPHHRFWAGALNGSYPWAPPGSLSGGPNTGLEDSVAQAQLSDCISQPQTCFLDNIDSWSTNEITINWNSILAWVLAFHVDYAQADTNANTPPNANISVDNNSGIIPLTISFNASGSSDADGDTLSYSWDFGDGASATGINVNHTYTQAGSVVATLTVNDSHGASDTSSITITATDDSNPSGDSVCEYTINNQWSSGFTASIRITNNGSTSINGWEVNWAYSDGSIINNHWNSNVSGNKPYTASNLPWNTTIEPGKYVEFGMQGVKGTANTPAQEPKVTGDLCF